MQIKRYILLLIILTGSYARFWGTPVYNRAELYDTRIHPKDVAALVTIVNALPPIKKGLVHWNEESGRVHSLELQFRESAPEGNHFSANDSIHIHKSIAQLDSLWALKISHGKGVTLPKELANLTNFEMLSINKTEMKSLPTVIGEYSHLKNLDISNNKLVSLPCELAQLKKLDGIALYFNNNRLKTVPTALDFHYADSNLDSCDLLRLVIARNCLNNPYRVRSGRDHQLLASSLDGAGN